MRYWGDESRSVARVNIIRNTILQGIIDPFIKNLKSG
jgi:hypothetical protein